MNPAFTVGLVRYSYRCFHCDLEVDVESHFGPSQPVPAPETPDGWKQFAAPSGHPAFLCPNHSTEFIAAGVVACKV